MRSKLTSSFVGAQWDFIDDDKTKFLHLSAGYGFGKTRTLCYKLLKLSKLNLNKNGGLVVPSYTDFTRDVKIAMEDIFHENNIKAKYHGQEHAYSFPWTRGKLYVATAEKKLRGPNWAYAGINEVTLIPMERYREVIGRVRIKHAQAPQIVSSGTPEGIASEYYTAFVEKPLSNSKILYGDTRDNAHNLDPGYVQSIIDSYPSQLIDAYLKGLWVNLSGNRFYFGYDPKRNDCNIERDDELINHIGIDLNVDPLCSNVWQERDGKLICVDEVVLEGGDGYKTENLLEAFKARGYTPNNSILYPDPASKARGTKGDPDSEIMRRAGFQVRMKSVAPRFRERQLNVNNRMEKMQIMINTNKAPKLKKDLLAVETDPVTLEKIKKNLKLTHASDAMDYLIDILMPFKDHRNTVSTHTIR